MKKLVVIVILAMVVPSSAFGQGGGDTVQATLLHTNDFHGRLEPDYLGRGGAAYLAGAINLIRDAVGDENVLLLDAGDEFFGGSPISELLLGESTIDVFNLMGYDLAVVGHSEFNEGQGVLSDRVAQSVYPWLGANVVVEGTDWDNPAWAIPYTTLTVGTPPDQAVLGVIGVATEETPEVNPLGVTDGLVFRDLTETILHYYDEVMGLSDALVVVAHMGTDDSGPYEGLVTVAQDLIDAGKPVDLMIGGHHHQALFTPVWVGDTAIVSAGYYGRWLGRLDVSIDTSSKRLTVDDYQLITITAEATIESLIATLEALYDEGKIANRGILNSLLRKLENARAALDRGQVHVAHNILSAFMNEVEDLAGSQIDADAAAALLEDAGWVVDHTDLEVAERVDLSLD
jgi:2',3'-cyclic-nucleotide 2'-phosphodiesterase (5'-nucleotidase family)